MTVKSGRTVTKVDLPTGTADVSPAISAVRREFRSSRKKPLRASRSLRARRPRSQRFTLGLLLIMLFIEPVPAQTPTRQIANRGEPQVFLLEAKQLQSTKGRLLAGDKTLAAAITKLEQEAQKALTVGPFSVVSKDPTPPSGDKHDYMSQAPYFWPDPKSPNGLPYIRRDGERNPEINKITDHRSMDLMVSAVETLALAYYFKGDEAYADKAALLLRAFFLDPKTRMNPHLQYAQFIPGVNTGRGIGLIETRGLTRVVDAVGLLAGAKSLTEVDRRGLQEWFAKFLQWMQESKNGRDEAAAKNNHGTYYDLQVASFALFLGKTDLAIEVLQASRQKRIATQIEPDGRQPLELVRTKAWSYSVGNLDGLMLLARLGENVSVDLWNYQTPDGRSIHRALDYLVPFSFGEQKWTHQQLGEWPPQMLFPLIRRAALRYNFAAYQSLLAKLPSVDAADRRNLLQPATGRIAGISAH
ncbi:MAG: alginate lyase family protein [Pyrinomonadaceae bacterium]